MSSRVGAFRVIGPRNPCSSVETVRRGAKYPLMLISAPFEAVPTSISGFDSNTVPKTTEKTFPVRVTVTRPTSPTRSDRLLRASWTCWAVAVSGSSPVVFPGVCAPGP